jgi:hypothetical protein
MLNRSLILQIASGIVSFGIYCVNDGDVLTRLQAVALVEVIALCHYMRFKQ